ncbi:MAG: hypothetical protein R3B47_13045 [Bacteroidia bacterium]
MGDSSKHACHPEKGTAPGVTASWCITCERAARRRAFASSHAAITITGGLKKTHAIIAFLKSDHPMTAARTVNHPEQKPSFQ